MDMLT